MVRLEIFEPAKVATRLELGVGGPSDSRARSARWQPCLQHLESQTCYYHLEDGLDMNDHRQRSHVEDFLVDECLWLMCQGLVTMMHSCEVY